MFAMAFAVAAAGGFVAGAIASQSLKGGLQGAFAAVVSMGIGVGVAQEYQLLAQAASGGIMESLQGGNFGHGFLVAGLTTAFMPQVGKIGNSVVRTAVGAIVGGTISDATGGKFANGALSGAIQAAMAAAPQGSDEHFTNTDEGSTGQEKLAAASEFEIGGKPFRVNGGTLEEKLRIQSDLRGIFRTSHGKEMLEILNSRKNFWFFDKEFVIDLTIKNDAYSRPYGNVIHIDPNFHPQLEMENGWARASTQRALAHELGHAVYGTRDVGLGSMMNIEMHENPIMNELGQPSRIRYEGFL
jgi:hypothetical protein